MKCCILEAIQNVIRLIVFKEKIPKSFQNLEILFTVQVSHMQYFLKMNKHEISNYKKRKKKSYYFLQNSNIQKQSLQILYSKLSPKIFCCRILSFTNTVCESPQTSSVLTKNWRVSGGVALGYTGGGSAGCRTKREEVNCDLNGQR